MARVHACKNNLYIAASKNVFQFNYIIDGQWPKLEVRRNIEVPFRSRSKNGQEETVAKDSSEDQILASALSDDGTLLAVATTSKECFFYDIVNEWTEVRPAVQLPKAPTAVVFENGNKFAVLSDRAGNVRRYSLDAKTAKKNVKDGQDEVSDCDEGNYEGELLLGHVSMVLDIGISDDGRFLISADRDEKIRISRYPQCYVIHQFCFGHTSYVNTVHSKNGLIFSSGGDGTLRVWNLENGQQIAQCDYFEKKAVRCCRMFPNSFSKSIKFALIFENCGKMQIVTFTRETRNFEVEYMSCTDFLIDIVVEESGEFIFGITRSAVVCGKVGGDHLEAISDVGENVVQSLRSIKDALPPLEKKIGFSNVEDYKQRKTERIKTKRRKLSAAGSA